MGKRIQSKCKFSHFCILARKLTKFVTPLCKPQVGFPLNFALTFSVMTHNLSEIFYLKHYILRTKRAHQCTIFRFLSALMKVYPIPHAIFEIKRSGFIQILHHYSVSRKITPLNFFSSKLIYFGQK